MRPRSLLFVAALAVGSPCPSARAEPPAPAPSSPSPEDLDALVGRIAESPAAGDAAVALLRRSGEAAVPSLVRGLRHPSEAVRRACAGLLAEAPGPRVRPEVLGEAWSLLRVPEAFVRLAAARILLRADGERTRVAALQVLTAESPADDLVALLRPALGDPSPLVRREAVVAVARVGPPVAALAPDVLRLLDASGVEDRVLVVRAAAATQPKPEAVLPLADRYAGETREVRAAILSALASADPRGARTALVVGAGLADPEAAVRGAAVQAVVGGVAVPAEARAAVVERLFDADEGVSASASRLLRGLGPGAAAWVPDVLAAAERRPDGKVLVLLEAWVESAGETYVALLPTAAPGSARALMTTLTSTRQEVVDRLAPALRETLPCVLRRGDLGEEGLGLALSLYERTGERTDVGMLAALVPLLAEPDGPLRRKVVYRLQSNGRAERTAVDLLSDPDPRAREGALLLLAALPSLSSASQEKVATLLFDRDPAQVGRAVRVLLPRAVPGLADPASGPLLAFDSEVVVGAVRAALRDEDPATRWRAAAVLGAMGRQALPAVEDLRPVLLDASRDVAVTAARALDRIARASATSARELLAADLASTDTARVAAALLALAEAGGYRVVVLPALDELLTQDDARTLVPALRAAASLRADALPLEPRVLALREHRDRVVVQAALDALASMRRR